MTKDYKQGLSLIPSYMQLGLIDYIEHGIRPGDFLCEVIDNHLAEAFAHADDTNRRLLPNYAQFLLYFMPAAAWGSTKARLEWQKTRCAEVATNG